jgi:hypothetical protein
VNQLARTLRVEPHASKRVRNSRRTAFLNQSARKHQRCAMRAYLLAMTLAVAAVSLAGCGTTPACRAGSTGLAGAAGGAVLGAIGGNAGLGALVGGLTGAAAGGLTSPNQAYAGPSPFCF